LQAVGRILDIAAAGAGQVAGAQGFQLQPPRELLHVLDPLPGQVRGKLHALSQRDGHCSLILSFLSFLSFVSFVVSRRRSSTGRVNRMDSVTTCRSSTSTGPRSPRAATTRSTSTSGALA